MRLLRRSSVALCLTALATLSPAARAVAPTDRTVYVTVVDNQGQAVKGLTAADFTLKEGGKEREIKGVEPATAEMRITLAVEETLTPLGAVRQGLADFVQKVAPFGRTELVIVGQSNKVVLPFTNDVNAFVTAINGLPLNQRATQVTHVPEGVADIARGFIKAKYERPVLVMVAIGSPQVSNEEPQNVLNQLKDSNALFHVVLIEAGNFSGDAATNMEMAGKAQVLGDGPKQAGGRQWAVNALPSIPKFLQQIAGELASQYKISYVLPDGQKASDRLSVELKRRGVTLRAPTRISDK